MIGAHEPKKLGRDFTLVSCGQGVSSVGTAVTSLALPLLAILELHAVAWQIGVLTAATYAAYALLALPLGALLDRRARRPLVILADVGRLIALGTVPITAAYGVLTYAQLVIVAVCTGAFSVVFDVAYQSWLPDLVGRPALLKANARMGAIESAGRLAGPGIAGLLVASVGAAYALGTDALSFGVAALFTVAVLTREQPPAAAARATTLTGDVREGLRWLWRAHVLRRITACNSTANFFVAAWAAVETIFLVHTLHAATPLIGAILAVGSSGGIAGAFVASAVTERLGDAFTLCSTMAAGGLCALIAPLGTALLGSWAVAVGLFGLSATNAVYNAAAVSRRQREAPPSMLARATAVNRVVSYGALPLGAVFGGLLASAAGARVTLVVAAAGYGAAAAWLIPLLRRGSQH